MHLQCFRFVVKEAVRRKGRTQVHDKVVYRAVSRVNEVGFVLEQFIDTLDDVSFSEHDLVPHGHKLVLHVGLEPMYEMDSLAEEFLLDISSAGKHLSIEFLGEHFPHPAIPVVDVCSREIKGYNLPRVVAQQVQLEAVTPSHGTLPVPGQPIEDFVEVASDVVAHRDHGVDKRNARAFAEGIEFHEHHHLEKRSWHDFHETIVGNSVGKLLPELSHQ